MDDNGPRGTMLGPASVDAITSSMRGGGAGSRWERLFRRRSTWRRWTRGAPSIMSRHLSQNP